MAPVSSSGCRSGWQRVHDVRVLIVDDEAVARRRVRRLLAGEPDVQIVGEAGDGRSAVAEIARTSPDLVLLDVQMPELDGFEVVENLPRDHLPAMIFVTAYDRYALQAFDVHAIDYLLKPFTPERFRTALDRARDRVRRRDHDIGVERLVEELRAGRRHLARLLVRSGRRIVVLDVDQIDWIQAADNYVSVRSAGRDYLLRDALGNLERQLDPARFVRIHRSVIVNVNRIEALEPATHGDFDVRLRDGTRLTLSRTFRLRLEQVLGHPL
jgi:two-component system, LytTR family, response regulator